MCVLFFRNGQWCKTWDHGKFLLDGSQLVSKCIFYFYFFSTVVEKYSAGRTLTTWYFLNLNLQYFNDKLCHAASCKLWTMFLDTMCSHMKHTTDSRTDSLASLNETRLQKNVQELFVLGTLFAKTKQLNCNIVLTSRKWYDFPSPILQILTAYSADGSSRSMCSTTDSHTLAKGATTVTRLSEGKFVDVDRASAKMCTHTVTCKIGLPWRISSGEVGCVILSASWWRFPEMSLPEVRAVV